MCAHQNQWNGITAPHIYIFFSSQKIILEQIILISCYVTLHNRCIHSSLFFCGSYSLHMYFLVFFCKHSIFYTILTASVVSVGKVSTSCRKWTVWIISQWCLALSRRLNISPIRAGLHTSLRSTPLLTFRGACFSVIGCLFFAVLQHLCDDRCDLLLVSSVLYKCAALAFSV